MAAMSVSSISSFSCLRTGPSNAFHSRRSATYGFHVGVSRRRHGLRLARAAAEDGGQIRMEMSGDGNSSQSGGGGGGFLQPFQWLFGSLFLVAIPIWRRIKKADEAIERADAVVETVENIADKIGQVAEDISDDLPEGRLKDAIDRVEDVAERVEDGARTLDNVLDKISDSLDDLEDAAEEAEKLKAKRKETGEK